MLVGFGSTISAVLSHDDPRFQKKEKNNPDKVFHILFNYASGGFCSYSMEQKIPYTMISFGEEIIRSHLKSTMMNRIV